MIPKLEIFHPETIEEASNLLSNYADSKIIAGGTDIIPGFHIDSPRFRNLRCLIDINGIHELKTISIKDENIYIGAGLTFSEIISSPDLNKKMPVLIQASKSIGSLQIRNRATLGGNFINNAPCADSVPALLVYDAKLKIQSGKLERIISLEEFLIKPYLTNLGREEIVTQVIIPHPVNGMKGEFNKLGRRKSVAISRISLAVLMLVENNIISGLKIACGAVTPTGIRLYEVERKFVGRKSEDNVLRELAIASGKKILDASGLRWSSEYKIPVVQQMLYQTLKKICGR